MRRFLARFSESEASNHTPSLADFTTTTAELKFSVHTGRLVCGLSVGFFHHALQRMLVLAGKIHHLCHLGFSDLVSKDAALAQSMMMYMQHNLGGSFGIFLE